MDLVKKGFALSQQQRARLEPAGDRRCSCQAFHAFIQQRGNRPRACR